MLRYPKLVLTTLFSALVVFVVFGVAPTEPKLTVAFLDVGQGDAIFIESPTGTQVLIDGGPDTLVLKRLSGLLSPFDRTLDMVLATHPDKDHIAGLPSIFERFAVGMFSESGTRSGSSYDTALRVAVEAEGLNAIHPKLGDQFDLGGGAALEVLFPDRVVSEVETNLSSVIMMLTYGSTRVLLTGDAPSAVENYLVRLGVPLDADVLKVGHHGSKTSSSAVFLSAVSPELSVISVGRENRYGHPNTEVVERLKSASSTILSTAEQGIIVLTSDGEKFKIEE